MRFFTLCIFLNGMFSFARSQGIIEFTDQTVIYRNYDNIFQIGSDFGQPNYSLRCNNCIIEKVGDDWKVRINSKIESQDLFVMNSGGDTLSKKTYKVFSLPNPMLFLGSCSDRDQLYQRAQKKLYVKYVGIQPICKYTIKNWQISIEGYEKKLKGDGDFLSEEALKIIGFAPKGALLTLQANCSDSEGKKLKLTSILKL
jgi:hypothetical protein